MEKKKAKKKVYKKPVLKKYQLPKKIGATAIFI